MGAASLTGLFRAPSRSLAAQPDQNAPTLLLRLSPLTSLSSLLLHPQSRRPQPGPNTPTSLSAPSVPGEPVEPHPDLPAAPNPPSLRFAPVPRPRCPHHSGVPGRDPAAANASSPRRACPSLPPTRSGGPDPGRGPRTPISPSAPKPPLATHPHQLRPTSDSHSSALSPLPFPPLTSPPHQCTLRV